MFLSAAGTVFTVTTTGFDSSRLLARLALVDLRVDRPVCHQISSIDWWRLLNWNRLSVFDCYSVREFSFLFYFSFSFQKMSFVLGRKCCVRNWTVTNFCDIGTGDFRFRSLVEKGISFSSAFSFTAENEKCIFFGRPLHQTVSDYTLRQWFSNTQQSRFPDSLEN